MVSKEEAVKFFKKYEDWQPSRPEGLHYSKEFRRKKWAKTGATHAVSIGTFLPGVGWIGNIASGMLAVRSIKKTDGHLDELMEIFNCLLESQNSCKCNLCPKAVVYAINQKERKLRYMKWKTGLATTGGAITLITAGAIPAPLGLLQTGKDILRKSAKKTPLTKESPGETRIMHAKNVHRAARRGMYPEDSGNLGNACPVARAIVDMLTNGNLARTLWDLKGWKIIATKLKHNT